MNQYEYSEQIERLDSGTNTKDKSTALGQIELKMDNSHSLN